ncbi:cytochrome P450 [Micromonospora lutea]|uniref:Fatty-acid peroxygenase n=1 Tax=Micromonospora lutea TaxID=419825 RepID=A0ABQ4ISV2_9ACTN|nr:cytochrome P450 [Micromonospora lutea]GIJ20980.1 fatty-acid peroxygenase [Micromonospora lutea]
MATIPTDRSPDSTLAFLRIGYPFIGQRCERYGSDIIQTRLLLTPTICMRGRAAAELFYDTDRFMREGAMPARGQRTLTGRGGVQGLDGDAHHDRKAMFLSLMTPTAVQRLGQLFTDEWRARLPAWELAGTVTLHPEVASMLTRAVCAWAGVPLAEGELDRRTTDLQAMIDSAASVSHRHWRGRLGRKRSEHWAGDLVEGIRGGSLSAPEDTALRVIAEHRDTEGRLLPRRIAAVELLNVIRPTVAVARFVVFAALALHDHPAWRQRVRDEDAIEQFVQEVRRYYPFFPVAAARVRRAFDWHGYHFPQGRRVLLDLYGTDHHPELWPEPEQFRPERFAGWRGDPFALVPQGGGGHLTGHRCAGEWITIELMKRAVTVLTDVIRYDVPPQDLAVDLSRMPALPGSGFVVTAVRRTD